MVQKSSGAPSCEPQTSRILIKFYTDAWSRGKGHVQMKHAKLSTALRYEKSEEKEGKLNIKKKGTNLNKHAMLRAE
jgi:hypothetical protein